METRFPFQYGIASMTELPHLFVSARITCDGVPGAGLSSEGLPPKWFSKNPATTFEEDLPEMIEVIRHASETVRRIASGQTFFEIWRELYDEQTRWAAERGIPPLLSNLGVSLMERAVIDALCRTLKTSFPEALHANLFGIRLGAVYGELKGTHPADFLPEAPLTEIRVRHTVGLGDPLNNGDITDPVDDGLPHSLESCIGAYQLQYFKVKICGDIDRDRDRLRALHQLLRARAGDRFFLTLDGNEQFDDIESFREHWESHVGDPEIRALFDHLLFVEQPLHRDHALADETGPALARWTEAPPLIIDESEAGIGCLPRALELGYAGTSHKNCKGIVKGIANACLLRRRREERRGGKEPILSGEDLANVGPAALLQDLTLMATLGIPHVERNGHHYFKGLSMYPGDVQDAVLSAHPDLYREHENGFATLRIARGRIAVASVVRAPFGTTPLIDADRFTPLADWQG